VSFLASPPLEEDRPPAPFLRPEPVRVVWALIAVNAAIFALETYWGGSKSSPTLYHMGAIAGRSALPTEPWRVLSSAFLHIGPAHLLVNMWALWAFGRSLEQLMGSARLLVLYALSALGGGTLSALGHDVRLAAGASGAVWGLMVAQLVLVLRPRSLFEDLTFEVNKLTVLQPLVINLLYSLQPGIDLLGHLGGGAAGGLAMASGLLSLRPGGAGWKVAAAVAALAMAGSIGLAFAAGQPWELGRPELVARPLGDSGITLQIPRALQPNRTADVYVYGNLRSDPLQVICTPYHESRVTDAPSRDAVLAVVTDDGGEQQAGLRLVKAPAVVSLNGRPASYQRLEAANGVGSEIWALIEPDGRALRVTVRRRPDLPADWKPLPERIAASVVFPPTPVSAH
jgi:rhomboid protease GluP